MNDVPNDQAADARELIREFGRRLEADFKWMRLCRHSHRALGILFTLVLVAIPPLVAAGILPSESMWGKLLLLAVTVVAALNSVFQPLALGDFRRQDMNQIRLLHDQFRADVVNAADDEKRIALFKDYTRKFTALFAGRSARLLDALWAGEEAKASAAPGAT
jgi:hypothetical protein